MLKSGILVVLALFLIHLVHTQMPPADAIDFCRTQEKLTDEDMEKWDDKTPTIKKLKCYEACLAEQTGQFVDNKLNIDFWTAKIDETYRDKETNEKYKDLVNECSSITDEDRCEMIEKVFDCIYDIAVERGLDQLI